MTEEFYGIQPVNDKTINLAICLIQQGKTVVIPTDTVYGVVANPTDKLAVEGIFDVKHRPHEKTVQILASSMRDTKKFGVVVPIELEPLVHEFMPGALSIIADIDSDVAQEKLATVRQLADGRLTQAVRLPANDTSLEILSATGALAASSANRSGRTSAMTAQEAYEQLGDTVPLYLDGGATAGPIASTVIAWDAQKNDIVVLREGVIAIDKIRAVLA